MENIMHRLIVNVSDLADFATCLANAEVRFTCDPKYDENGEATGLVIIDAIDVGAYLVCSESRAAIVLAATPAGADYQAARLGLMASAIVRLADGFRVRSGIHLNTVYSREEMDNINLGASAHNPTLKGH